MEVQESKRNEGKQRKGKIREGREKEVRGILLEEIANKMGRDRKERMRKDGKKGKDKTKGRQRKRKGKEGRKVGKGEEALFYYITRRMKKMLIAIISFKGKTL